MRHSLPALWKSVQGCWLRPTSACCLLCHESDEQRCKVGLRKRHGEVQTVAQTGRGERCLLCFFLILSNTDGANETSWDSWVFKNFKKNTRHVTIPHGLTMPVEGSQVSFYCSHFLPFLGVTVWMLLLKRQPEALVAAGHSGCCSIHILNFSFHNRSSAECVMEPKTEHKPMWEQKHNSSWPTSVMVWLSQL